LLTARNWSRHRSGSKSGCLARAGDLCSKISNRRLPLRNGHCYGFVYRKIIVTSYECQVLVSLASRRPRAIRMLASAIPANQDTAKIIIDEWDALIAYQN